MVKSNHFLSTPYNIEVLFQSVLTWSILDATIKRYIQGFSDAPKAINYENWLELIRYTMHLRNITIDLVLKRSI